jgi:ABC-type transport system involved in cytochrome c biogenesis ATPase subunit
MLNKVTIRNFKKFSEVEIELGDPVVFVGPNNSGKTSALQALALWDIGLKRWCEKRKGKVNPEKRPGVAINRRDLVAVPVPRANHLWRDLHVRDARMIKGKQDTKNVRIDIIVEGVTRDVSWKCGLEFDYANEESFYCRPLRTSECRNPDRMPILPEAEKVRIALLPPMSGLATNETRLDPGAINVRIGEGRTAEVLRNLCYIIHKEDPKKWDSLQKHIQSLFGAGLDDPEYILERGEVVMSYHEDGRCLDISSSGRGLQQTLLLLAYMYNNPDSALLLDEPDAHLEILRQRQIYQLLTDVGQKNGSQIIAATHSEVLLNEAADRDVVIAFLGQPHRIDDRGSQVLKSLRDIGFEDYYQAEQTGWVLYLEGSTDLAILRALAKSLRHSKAQEALERPFVRYVGNKPKEVQKHFFGVREAVKHLQGIALFDRLEQELPGELGPKALLWKRREIENYLCCPETLIAYAEHTARLSSPGELFSAHHLQQRVHAMKEAIDEISKALEVLGDKGPWDEDTKASDVLDRIFRNFFKKLDLPNIIGKKNFYELVDFVPENKLDPEIKDKLDAIADVFKMATPAQITA